MKKSKIKKETINSTNSSSSALDEISSIISSDLSLEENDESSKDLKSLLNIKRPRKKPKGKFFIDPKGRRVAIRRRRKEDNIRKKIKSAFHKYMRLYINNALKKAGSKYIFETLPQHFISDITKKTNYRVMNMPYGELFKFTYLNLIKDKNYRKRKYNKVITKAAIDKYNRNKKTLEYLDCNPEINEKSGWEKIKNSKYSDLLNDYFNTDNFKKLVEKLSQKEDKAYMDSFKFFSDNYVEFFLSYKQNEASSKKIKINTRMNSSINNTNIYQNSVLSDFTRSCSYNSNCLVNFPIPEEMNIFSDSDEDLADEKSLRLDEIGNNIGTDNY